MKKTITGLMIAVAIAAGATWVSGMIPFVSLDNDTGVGGLWSFVVAMAIAAALYWWMTENIAFVIAGLGLLIALLCRWGGFELLQDIGWLGLIAGVSAGILLATVPRPRSGH
ncbi:MAG TPA: hypothetical protein VGE53_02695 [Candidatus Paceibacterota bacterium]